MLVKTQLGLAEAKAVAAAAHDKAVENGWNVVIALVDEGGYLHYLERMDGAQMASVLIAQEKARTAALFRRPSKELEEAIASGRQAMLAMPGATPLEGGVPLIYRGELVGAIGVSGVRSFQDGLIAQAGADHLALL